MFSSVVSLGMKGRFVLNFGSVGLWPLSLSRVSAVNRLTFRGSP